MLFNFVFKHVFTICLVAAFVLLHASVFEGIFLVLQFSLTFLHVYVFECVCVFFSFLLIHLVFVLFACFFKCFEFYFLGFICVSAFLFSLFGFLGSYNCYLSVCGCALFFKFLSFLFTFYILFHLFISSS